MQWENRYIPRIGNPTRFWKGEVDTFFFLLTGPQPNETWTIGPETAHWKGNLKAEKRLRLEAEDWASSDGIASMGGSAQRQEALQLERKALEEAKVQGLY